MRRFINNLIFGLFGALCLFILNVNDIYRYISGWIYLLVFVTVIFIPMIWLRYSNKQESTFGELIKTGLFSFIISMLVSTVATSIYVYQYLSHAQKKELIDQRVSRQIMEYEGDNIDIFSYHENAMTALNPTIEISFFKFLLSFPFILFISIVIALILKPRLEPDVNLQVSE